MANRNFNGVQINQSVTIVEQAGAAITDARNRILAYNTSGDVILAECGNSGRSSHYRGGRKRYFRCDIRRRGSR